METRQLESSDRSQSTTTTTTLPPNHTNAILNPSISQPSLLPRSTSSTSTSERSNYFLIFLATSLWLWISQNRLAVLGAGVTFAGFVIGLAALVPAFAGQDMSQEALELARWTAMKDFIEQCWERKANGPVSEDCENAMAASLPPPPHVDFDKKLDKLVGRMSDSAFDELRLEHTGIAEQHTFGVIQLSACVGMYIVILLAWLYVQETLRRLRWRWSLSVPRREFVSNDGIADEEIGEFSYDYVELRPEPIRPSTIADRLQSTTLDERARASLPEVPDEDKRETRGNSVEESPVTSAEGYSSLDLRATHSHADEVSDDRSAHRAWLSGTSDETHARFLESSPIRGPTPWDTGDFTAFSPGSLSSGSHYSAVNLGYREPFILDPAQVFIKPEPLREAATEKERLSARFEVKTDDAASMRRRQNMAAQRNRRVSIVSDKSTGSVARVRRDEYATSSSNAFGGLEGLEELKDEDGYYEI